MTGSPLRIFAVTNRLPPGDRSGYALGCLRTVEALKARGHEVRFLSSSLPPGPGAGDRRGPARLAIDRELTPSWQAAFLKELVNQSSFRTACREFRPDAVLVFDLTGISVSMANLAEDFGLPVIFFVASDWLATWERDIWYRARPKVDAGFKVLRFLSRRFGLRPVSDPLASSRLIFASRHLESMARQVGKTWARGAVVPWGVDTARFSPRSRAGGPRGRRLLYVGRIWQEKGLDVLVRALGRINRDSASDHLSLTVAGDERPEQGYTAYLRELASSCGVLENVTLARYVPPSDMPELYRAHDIFVFPSGVVEPLSTPLLEAMACGLGVVSTATGGNAEFLEDEANALVIPPENADRCAAQVLRPRVLEDEASDVLAVRIARGPVSHRAELEHLEGLSVLPDSLLAVQDRAGRVELDPGGDEKHQRSKKGKQCGCQADVKEALQRQVAFPR